MTDLRSSGIRCGRDAAAPRLRCALRAPVNHKRKRPKHRRPGCLLCKPPKLSANKTADHTRPRRRRGDASRTAPRGRRTRRARGATSGADAASGSEGRLSGRIAHCSRTRAPVWPVLAIGLPPPPAEEEAEAESLRVSKHRLRKHLLQLRGPIGRCAHASSKEASGWFSRRNSAKSGTVKSTWPRRGLQISPFWISDSRKTETPRVSLAP